VLANPLTSHNDLAAILAEQHLIAKETQAWKELMDFVRETETVAS
jgi:glutamate decarboxylase